MRRLYLLSAMPGTGKSTFIKKHELDAVTLSLDTLRTIYAGTATDDNGRIVLSNGRDDLIFAKFMEALEIRMQAGGIIFIDNLNATEQSIDFIYKLNQKYDYDYRIVRFPLEPMQFYIDRNNQREAFKRLPTEALDRIYETFKKFDFKEKQFVITPAQAIAEVLATPDDLIVDLNSYNKLHFIGDLQGCYYPLEKYLQDEGGLKKNEFYIFVGDYMDRGIQNDKCLEFVNDHMDDENVVLVMGNHERHLYNYANDLLRPPNDFMHNTLPQLHRAKMSKEYLKNLYQHMQLFHFASYREKKIFTSHAGLTGIPSHPHLLNHDEYLRGYGGYSYNVDKKFQELNEENEWYQVHGHRNQYKLTFESYKKSFALECDVEFGGNLPVLRLNPKGFDGVYVPNLVFNRDAILKKEVETNMFETKQTDKTAVPETAVSGFLQNKINPNKNGLEIIKDLRTSELINERVIESMPHISAFNFTTAAFFDKKFEDNLVVQARGLFMNTETGDIVARGFEKFFNLNERGVESAKLENYKANSKGPYQLYEKENGFLGILGYDNTANSLIYASKADIGGDYSTYFKNIVQSQFNTGELEFMKIFANKHNVNFLFEVNDPENDPHIIEYNKKEVVLIGVVKREFKFSQLTYEKMKEFSESFTNMPIKKKFVNFDNLDSFEKFHNAVSKESALTTKRKVEGYVIQDANCNMIKVKLPYYSFWKTMREMSHKVNRSISKSINFDITDAVNNHFLIQDVDKVHAVKFLENFKLLSDVERKQSIVILRNKFLAQFPECEVDQKQKTKRLKPN